MNPILLALAVLFFTQMSGKKDANPLGNLGGSGIFGEGTKEIFDSLGKFTSGKGDKMGAILELLSNPVVFELAKNMLFKEKTQKEEVYSEESKEFFRPVEKVAGVEISKELYKLYDNWYLK